MTTMKEIQDSIRQLGEQIRTAAQELASSAANPLTPMDSIQKQQDSIHEMQERLTAMQKSYDTMMKQNAPEKPVQTAEKSSLRDMLSSREYARAFASAIRTGARPGRSRYDESLKPLYDALTIAGGDPAGEDGGFLVPTDIDTAINEQRRALNPLADIFGQEMVSANSGWRVIDTAPTSGMTALTSEVPTSIATDDQPTFQKVSFNLTTYGLIVPVSAELAADETANLFQYLASWFARKQVLTENTLLKGKLDTLTSANIGATTTLADIKKVLNVTLDPAISMNAHILCSQDAYNYLDTLADSDGRPLLMPDPTAQTGMMLKGRPIHVVSNTLMPTRTVTTAGATKGDYYPIYIGDFTQYATLFRRNGLEIASTDIGGNAFRTNAVEVRGIARMGVSVFDAGAAVKREIFIAAT